MASARPALNGQTLSATAADVADELGFEHVTVSEVARRVGVKPASVYFHLDGADDLRGRVSALALTELGERLALALAGRAGRDALEALVDAVRGYAVEHPGRWASTQVRITAPEAGAAGARVAALMLAVVRGYGLPPKEQTHAVRLIGSTVNGFVRLHVHGSFDHSDPDPEASWLRMTQALDTALTHWPTTATSEETAR
ncbi:TetR/AcrR family transcriptional regulator [Aeromicrobium duanguangcaii]|uniref:TetR/AcrR family transcriptional regulator n=1 Tax=Aeromicrobium duanguangcaii TaxID=2968086 RepID=A0ABY5KHS4_9ACTN|nr:TetR/AcrR family transcriptional regulator [Aeromicrobium duanguangcaii]MCD9153040.1 TetR/AcrR family transcriptional regulator [Aeromicrobium duanguangcaii]UUI69854.1 TetR/AcrR family transcriptional regulator [Aeromicrobium duanguangcaii]